MDVRKVPPPQARQAVDQLQAVLDSPEVGELIRTLEEARWTGRKGYPIRAMVGMCLVKSIYALPTWSRVCRLVAEHDGLQRVLGCIPSDWAVYRFAQKLRTRDADALARCIDGVIGSLRDQLPHMGQDVAVDGSDLPAYANGHRERQYVAVQPSDPDASWGHRSAISTRSKGSFYGFKLHAAVDTATDLPLAWTVRSAREAEQNFAIDLIDTARKRGFRPRTAIMDKGYDSERMHFETMKRSIAPVIPLKQTGGVKQGLHKPPCCEHGEWKFCGSDFGRRCSKWRCPTGECQPKSYWMPADRHHPLIPRESKRYAELYAKRSAVEREFGRLKHQWSLLPLRVRGLDRVQLHADLTILACLASRLAQERARTVPLAA